MKELFRKAVELLNEKKEFVYTAIISKSGSSPAGIGARMIVTDTGVTGTIGGGGVEGDIIRLSRELLQVSEKDYDRSSEMSKEIDYSYKKGKKSFIKKYVLESEEAAVSDFICGGSCEVLAYYVNPFDMKNTEVFIEAEKASEAGGTAWFVYSIDKEEKEDGVVQIALSVEGKGVYGEFTGSEKVTKDMAENPIRISIHSDTDSSTRYIVDKLTAADTIYLFGAGHVSQKVAELAVNLEYMVKVIDDRKEFLNESRFPGCELVLIESFEKLPELKIDKNSYIMIITRGHLNDKTVLKWALDKSPAYLGMIGSKTKRDKLYEQLINEGSSIERIKTVHCPIGLAIGAKTPGEIGISIMAEVIKTRHSA